VVVILGRLVDDLKQLQLLHPGQGLPQKLVLRHQVNQRRIQPGLKVVAVKPGDCPARALKLKLGRQTEGRVKPGHEQRTSGSPV
jgi:hypothetical protein